MKPRSLRPVRVLTGALLLGAVGAALAPAGPDALVPFKLIAASAADQVYVAVVVEFGDGTTTTHCVPVSSGESDEQALAEVYSVEENSSGLICDINDMPSSDTSQCLQTGGNGTFYYWSYWHGGTGSWQYSSVGPAGYATSSGDVEGWRFQNPGADNPSAPPPDASPSYATICQAELSSPPTAPSPPASAPAPPVSISTTTAPTPSRGGSNTSTATTTKNLGASTRSAAGNHPTTTTTVVAGLHSSNSEHHDKTALADRTASSSSSSGAPILPIVLIGVVILLLAGLGYFRWRQRPAQE